jgi:tetratricopeptide (TPR) repeat protein
MKGKIKYVESGKKYLKSGKYQEASIQFRNAIKLDPRYPEAYYQLAQADLSLRQWNAAYADLQQTISLDPQRVESIAAVGGIGQQIDARTAAVALADWASRLAGASQHADRTHRRIDWRARLERCIRKDVDQPCRERDTSG